MRTYGVVNGGGWASDVVGGGSVTNYIAIEQSYCPLHISLFLSFSLSLSVSLSSSSSSSFYICFIFVKEKERKMCFSCSSCSSFIEMMFNRFGLNLGRMAGRLIAAPSLSRRRQLLDNFNRVLLRSPGWIFNVIGNSKWR